MVYENMSVLNMTMPESLYRNLKELAKKKNISLAALVRIACSDLLEREKK